MPTFPTDARDPGRQSTPAERMDGTRSSSGSGGADKIAWAVIGLGIIVYLATRHSSHSSLVPVREE